MSREKTEQFQKWQNLPFNYDCMRGRLSDVYKSDLILFWGDFLHSRDYLYQVRDIYQSIEPPKSSHEIVGELYDYLYFSHASNEVLTRCIVFGGTLIFNRERDYQDNVYTKNLSRLFRSAYHVWMRDVYSALRVNRIMGDSTSINSLGVDCSLLLQEEDLKQLETTDYYESTLHENLKQGGIFFGRTSNLSPKVIQFVRDLFGELDATPEWFPWFAPFVLPNPLPKILEQLPDLKTHDANQYPLLGDLLNRIKQFKFMVTDTYHVCLNAWRVGVPAICIGEMLSTEAYDVSAGWRNAWRDKRQTFYFMHDAMDLYVYKEEIINAEMRKVRLNQLSQALRDGQLVQGIHENISTLTKKVEEVFIDQLLLKLK